MHQSLSTTWYRYTSRGSSVLAGAGDPGAGAGLPVHQVAELGRVGQAGRHDVARRDLRVAARRPGRCESSPSLCRVCSTSMNSSPRPYLNVTRRAVDPSRDQQHLLVLDVHALDGPMPSGKHEGLRLAERLGREPAAVLLEHDRRVQALLDRGPDREGRGEVVARRRPGWRRRGRRSRRSDRTARRLRSGRRRRTGRARRPCRPAPAGPAPPTAAASANCSSPSLTPVSAYGRSGWRCDSDMAMSR